jgi:hypothetical protein
MTVAEYLEGFSVEGLVLAGASLCLFLIVVGLHVKNMRWMREMAQNQASTDSRLRIEKLISSVEKMTTAEKKIATTRARPLNKGRKVVSASRSAKPPVPRRRAR